MKIYLDNAATTPIDPQVVQAMLPILENNFGNPSSIHSLGRESRVIIEQARKKVASFINAAPSEIFFTAGGTEADNMVLRSAVNDLGVNHIITSPLEHHAVIDTAEYLGKGESVKLSLVKHDDKAYVDLAYLEQLLAENKDKKTLVSLMHANNEIGNKISLKKVNELCKKYGAYFHSDTVQTMCHYKFDVRELGIDFLTCSAHKFHGPKGVGFLFINQDVQIKPIITGGAQERNMRAGTENIYGIVGLTKAMEIAYNELEEHQNHIQGLKTYMIKQLEKQVPGISFNGDPKGDSLYTVLNVTFPNSEMDEMLLYNFDIEGICVSGGSACSSGSNVGSHVLKGIGADMTRPAIRFSFSKYNTKEELDVTLKVIKELFAINV
ncbi:MAG: cysteine desulfurase [Flavobacteriales bacterium]|nr:cysteine desulfurase [Flavobacteriales bacterium]MCB9364071.1 cysteine desulfurase [Flavobacteriales bacterium]